MQAKGRFHYGNVLFLSKIKQLRRADVQNAAKTKHHIQRYAHRRQLNGAHMAAINIQFFRQLHLRQPGLFAVKCNVEPQAALILIIGLVHGSSPSN